MKIIDTKKVKRILITRTDRIGDLVLSTPVFEAIKRSYPDAKIYVIVLPGNADVLLGNPYIDEVFLYDKRGKHKSIISTIAFARSIRKYKFDLAIHLHPTNRAHMISFFAGIPIRVGYNRNYGLLLTHKIADLKHEGRKHESVYNFDLLKFVGIEEPVNPLRPFFPISGENADSFNNILQYEKIGLSKFFVVFPGASCCSKKWSLKNFVEVTRTLINKYGYKVVVIGGEGELELARTFSSNINSQQVVNLVAKLSLKELGVLFSRADFMISNDSGPAHIASCLDLPLVTIFGRNDAGLSPIRWKPLGKRSYFLHEDPGCTKCLAHNCDKSFMCLSKIKPANVLEVVEKSIIPTLNQ